MLLSAFSIGRFSAAYWGNYILNNEGIFPTFTAKKSTKNQQLFFLSKFWKKVFGGDAAGAVSGAGTALLNRKPVIRGSIFGAIIGSAVAAVKEIFT